MFTMKSARKLYKRMCAANGASSLPAHQPGFKRWARAVFEPTNVDPRSEKLLKIVTK